MVDTDPWDGNFAGTVVQNNTIMGGFATNLSTSTSQNGGVNTVDAIIKSVIFNEHVVSTHSLHRIGLAIGPNTWFNNVSPNRSSNSGNVWNNRLSGIFGYGMVVSSARNFTVQGNVLFGNTSFVAARGPNCSASDPTPPSGPFIVQRSDVIASNLQSDFVTVQDATGLTCIQS